MCVTGRGVNAVQTNVADRDGSVGRLALCSVASAVALVLLLLFAAGPARADAGPPLTVTIASRGTLAPDINGASGAVLTVTIDCPAVYNWADGGFIVTQRHGGTTSEADGFHKFESWGEVKCDGVTHTYVMATNMLVSGRLRSGWADVHASMDAMTIGGTLGTSVNVHQRVLLRGGHGR
jgi:hypothetical protein